MQLMALRNGRFGISLRRGKGRGFRSRRLLCLAVGGARVRRVGDAGFEIVRRGIVTD